MSVVPRVFGYCIVVSLTAFSVICNKTFYKVCTLFSHTHLTTLSQLLAVGGVTLALALKRTGLDLEDYWPWP